MEVTNINKSNEVFDGFIKGLFSMPSVKIKRDEFLKEALSKYSNNYDRIEKALKVGPLNAGYSLFTIDQVAKKVMSNNVVDSTKYSFFAGIPGGLAMAATIPADTAQFYAHALILAQKLAYLYGYEDLWKDEHGYEDTKNQMLLFLGVMFGVSGSTATLKVVTANLSNQALKKLPQKALTKTIYYPMIKKIAKILGVNITKQSFAKGVSKVIPVLSGIISGGITYASLSNMGEKLRQALSDGTSKSYTEEEYNKDIQSAIIEDELAIDSDFEDIEYNESNSDKKDNNDENVINIIEQLEKLKKLKESNAITDEEFECLKVKVLEKTQ